MTDSKKILLELVTPFKDVDEFQKFSRERLTGMTGFFLCIGIETKNKTEFAFFTPSEGDGPEVAFRTTAALCVALKAQKIFLGYAANLDAVFGDRFGDLGSHQAIFFVSDSDKSHPYQFCKLESSGPQWLIKNICVLDEPDLNNQVFMSDVYQYLKNQTDDYVQVARKSLEDWRPDIDWQWPSYDS